MNRNSALFTSPVGSANAPNYATDFGIGGEVGVHTNIATDGTPTRAATLLIGAGVVLAALRLSGFRFNVGVSS